MQMNISVFEEMLDQDLCGSVVDHSSCIVLTTGSMAAVKQSMNQLSIYVGVGGFSSTWKREFLSPAAGHKGPAHICAGRWKAVNLFKFHIHEDKTNDKTSLYV